MRRTVLITGATRGIGREVARQLHAADFAVFVTGRDPDLLASLQRELDCPGLALDLSPADAPTRLYAAAREALGQVDVLANLGVRGETPLLARWSAPVTPGEPGRWLEGFYPDRPEEWDDPYRFFRW
jgi:NAD(P)-dependent dehydrogenase (short-subunit alcohol dehydrogenase family)